MWNIDQKKIPMLGFDVFMMNSPFSFPRLPPGVNNRNMGISKTGNLKDDIINDNTSMLSQLFDFHVMFQRYASGLFDMAPSTRFGPGHPMHAKADFVNLLKEENEQLKKENSALKRDLDKRKKN